MSIPSIPAFDFLIFQPNPKKEIIYYYVDGEKTRRLARIDDFLSFISSQPVRVEGNIHEAMRTYSFYLWSYSDSTITHLMPNSGDTTYPDSLANIFTGKAPIIKETKTLEEILMSYGFDTPNQESVSNLRVSISNKDKSNDTMLSRLFSKLRKK